MATVTCYEDRTRAIFSRVLAYQASHYRAGSTTPEWLETLINRMEYRVECIEDANRTPFERHIHHCDTKYCSECFGVTEEEFDANEARLDAEHHNWSVNFPGDRETDDMAKIHELIASVGYDAATVQAFQSVMAHLQLKHSFQLRQILDRET